MSNNTTSPADESPETLQDLLTEARKADRSYARLQAKADITKPARAAILARIADPLDVTRASGTAHSDVLST